MMDKEENHELPLIYSCSGCSNIAQLANQIAVELDRDQVAEMSCIAGVGGGVKSLVKKAKSGRKIISLDGCSLHCVKNCLARHSIESTHHYTLTNYGIKKMYHMDFSPSDVIDLKKLIIDDINKA
ncbi:MAG: putative zinc-binding protein [Moraxellaceae bacterium]|jgi:uncharacterized metal-binding protein|nr:putative zinc-binding protein [Moraxellaceae bacterium]MBK7300903.1 putative zinc-binding protein [Moraxellaceae bacterium]MBL0231610.1 putative zinc-binding protein [Moraxellaceae bacterium]HQV80944.1 putative zinc-binding protein [Agitococcus sp.]